MSREIRVTWWGLRWPWRWRFYYVEHPEWGWNEVLLGFVGFTWVNRRWR